MTIPTIAQSNILDDWRTTINVQSSLWNNLGSYDDISIIGGSIEGTTIGSSTPATGEFTTVVISSTLDIRGGTLLIDDNTISGDAIDGGAASVTTMTITGSVTNTNHAATKQYVDNVALTVGDDAVALAIALG